MTPSTIGAADREARIKCLGAGCPAWGRGARADVLAFFAQLGSLPILLSIGGEFVLSSPGRTGGRTRSRSDPRRTSLQSSQYVGPGTLSTTRFQPTENRRGRGQGADGRPPAAASFRRGPSRRRPDHGGPGACVLVCAWRPSRRRAQSCGAWPWASVRETACRRPGAGGRTAPWCRRPTPSEVRA